MWSNDVGKNRKTDEEHDDDCVKEGFPLDRDKLDKGGEGGRKVVGMGCCSINIWYGSVLKTVDISKQFSNILLSGNSVLKVCSVLR